MPLGHRELVRLKMTPQQVNNFTPPKGIDITWHDYDYYQDEVTASITALQWAPDDTEFVYKEEVNHMLTNLKVAQDGIRSSKYPLPFIRTVDTCKDFIENTEYDYLISKGKISTEIVDKSRINSIKPVKAEMFYDEKNRKRYKLENIGFVV